MENKEKPQVVGMDNYENVDIDIPEYVNITDIKLFQTGDDSLKNTVLNNKAKIKNPTEDCSKNPNKKSYSCDYCLKEFNVKKLLTVHIRVHTNERPYKCEVCEKAFKQLSSINSHMITHTKTKAFSCQFCSGAYTTSSSLKRHIKKIHQTGKALECGACLEKFYNMVSLKEHKLQQHPEIWQRFECSICKQVLQSQSTYRKHMINVHAKEKLRKVKLERSDTYTCCLCGDYFARQIFLTHHYNEHLQYTKRDISQSFQTHNYPCKICKEEFCAKYQVLHHFGKHHMEKKYECEDCAEKCSYLELHHHKKNIHHKFECSICNQAFEGKMLLLLHNKKYHLKKIYECKMCKKKFLQKRQLQLHYVQHGESYECQLCKQVLNSPIYLTTHLRLKHNEIQREYCKMCNKSFKNFIYLKKHHISTHFVRINKKLLFCTKCDKKYSSKLVYKEHMKQHRIIDKRKRDQTNSKKSCLKLKLPKQDLYTCTKCNKKFSAISGLRNHILIHILSYRVCRFCGMECRKTAAMKLHMIDRHKGEKVFYCEHCDAGFDFYNEVKNHFKIKHNNLDFIKEWMLLDCTKEENKLESVINNQERNEIIIKQEQYEVDGYINDTTVFEKIDNTILIKQENIGIDN